MASSVEQCRGGANGRSEKHGDVCDVFIHHSSPCRNEGQRVLGNAVSTMRRHDPRQVILRMNTSSDNSAAGTTAMVIP